MLSNLLVRVLGLQKGVFPNFELISLQIDDVSDLSDFGEIFQRASIDEDRAGLLVEVLVDNFDLHDVISLDVFSVRSGAIDNEAECATSNILSR